MVVGPVGLHGVGAAKTVGQVNNNVHETAQTHRLATVEGLALETSNNFKRVTHTIVQVENHVLVRVILIYSALISFNITERGYQLRHMMQNADGRYLKFTQ